MQQKEVKGSKTKDQNHARTPAEGSGGSREGNDGVRVGLAETNALDLVIPIGLEHDVSAAASA